jgi:nucleotide-binding universal stress UspA family protein
MSTARTIVCGVDGSPGGRTAVRVAAALANQFDARLIAVHVLDRLMAASETAERAAASILFEEAPDSRAEARGEFGDVAERLAAVARSEAAAMIILGAVSRGRARTFFRASRAAELADMTNVPVLVVPTQQIGDQPRRDEPAAAELNVTGGDR